MSTERFVAYAQEDVIPKLDVALRYVRVRARRMYNKLRFATAVAR